MTPIELPQYRCHKIVGAAKITSFRENGNSDMPDLVLGEIGAIVTMLSDWHAKHKPHVGGYFVKYEDGYTSFSPAAAFEAGYSKLVILTEADAAADLAGTPRPDNPGV